MAVPVLIKTHNAVSVPATNGLAPSAWICCEGFKDVAFTFRNAGAFAGSADLQWSNDGVTQHGLETAILAVGTTQYKQGITSVKAPYFRLILANTDASARIMDAWAYLKLT